MSANARRSGAGSWIGRDLARVRALDRRRRRPLAGLLFTALACALGLAALRIDILRARYALAEAIHEEMRLQQQERQWTARVEGLSDPTRLAALARRLGFERPSRVVELSSVPHAGMRP